MKNYSQFVCQQCGYISPGSLGKCPNCDSWGSFVETVVNEKAEKLERLGREGKSGGVKSLKLSEIKMGETERIKTGIEELDRVLGGGIVPGSAVLIAGDPGIGKSTLLLKIGEKTGGLYVSGEESSQQIKIRADRLKIKNEKLKVLTSTDVDDIISLIEEEKPKLVVVDSIQTMETEELNGAAGSVGQVRECGQRLTRAIKKLNIPLFMVGHVTKEGSIAGPKVLEHLVDTVLYLEGERFQNLRILRAVKNRYGTTDEVGIFKMTDRGMEEVVNPSEIFLNEDLTPPMSGQANLGKVGSCRVCMMEGNRPILIEIQALVVPTSIPIPRRVVSGVDYNRVQLMCAIIQKYLNIPLYSSDIFVSTTGGIKILEPAGDLGIVLAIISSFKNKPLPPKTLAIGEVGLLGEIRRVGQLERRIKEGKKMGFINILSLEKGSTLEEIVKNNFV